MEELIWKHIDNTCTDDEVMQVKQYLSTDAGFKTMYNECLHLNNLLKEKANIPIAPIFKTQLAAQIERELTTYRQPSANILPTWLIISLVLAGIMSLFIVSLIPDQNTNLINFDLPIDDRSMSLAIWSMATFICLAFADYLLNKTSFLKQKTHIFS
jgi:hypothetical protein